MELRDVVIVGVALAMDALGVTLSIGLNSKVNRSQKIAYINTFAFFQFFLFFIGGVLGFFFEKHIALIPHIIGGGAIALVGLMMIKEGFSDEENNEEILLKLYMPLILGISVSIDALVVGFTAFHNISNYSIMFTNSVIVGIITLLICTTGFYSCRFIRRIKFIVRYADFLGGVILLLFSIKMIFF